MKKLITIVLASAMMLFGTTACKFFVEEDNQQVIEAVTKSVTAQTVYTTMKKDKEKYETVWNITKNILAGVDTSLAMTPEELIAAITAHVSEKLNADYAMTVENILNVVFAKYKIVLNNNLTKEQLSSVINVVIESIDVGLDRYKTAYEIAVGAIPDEMPDDPFVQ